MMKKNKSPNKYHLITHCRKCDKLIIISLVVSIKEVPKYGQVYNYIPEKLPPYLYRVLEEAQRSSEYHYMYYKSPKDIEEEKAILCSTCAKLKRLKE